MNESKLIEKLEKERIKQIKLAVIESHFNAFRSSNEFFNSFKEFLKYIREEERNEGYIKHFTEMGFKMSDIYLTDKQLKLIWELVQSIK